MAKDMFFADLLRDLYNTKKTGQLFVNVLQSSEDLIRIYIRRGEIYYFSYGSAIGQDAIDVVEYYTFGNATFLEGSLAPAGTAASRFSTSKFIEMMRKSYKRVRVP